jgi:predicted flap endonuclease-1-like 5' DNA nuclease
MSGRYSVLIGLLLVSPALIAFSGPLQAAGQKNRIPWWVWVLIVLVLLVLLLWWWRWLRRRPEKEIAPAARMEAVAPAPVAETPAPVTAPAAPPTPDDLKRVEGIGPKISSVFQAAGITTFAQLAATDVSRLRQILTEAGLASLADPTTWPEQARLAAAGEWDALEVLQNELKGGRRA